MGLKHEIIIVEKDLSLLLIFRIRIMFISKFIDILGAKNEIKHKITSFFFLFL